MVKSVASGNQSGKVSIGVQTEIQFSNPIKRLVLDALKKFEDAVVHIEIDRFEVFREELFHFRQVKTSRQENYIRVLEQHIFNLEQQLFIMEKNRRIDSLIQEIVKEYLNNANRKMMNALKRA